VQHPQRGAGRREQVDGVGEPADVLELQVQGVVQVDVGLRGAVDVERPGAGPVGVTGQLGEPVVGLEAGQGRAQP
jgi:hypothetical protein